MATTFPRLCEEQPEIRHGHCLAKGLSQSKGSISGSNYPHPQVTLKRKHQPLSSTEGKSQASTGISGPKSSFYLWAKLFA